MVSTLCFKPWTGLALGLSLGAWLGPSCKMRCVTSRRMAPSMTRAPQKGVLVKSKASPLPQPCTNKFKHHPFSQEKTRNCNVLTLAKQGAVMHKRQYSSPFSVWPQEPGSRLEHPRITVQVYQFCGTQVAPHFGKLRNQLDEWFLHHQALVWATDESQAHSSRIFSGRLEKAQPSIGRKATHSQACCFADLLCHIPAASGLERGRALRLLLTKGPLNVLAALHCPESNPYLAFECMAF